MVMNVVGEVENKRAIIVDDLIDTAGTLVEGAEALYRRGAKEIYACATPVSYTHLDVYKRQLNMLSVLLLDL